jgi:hypothetical protein
MGHDRISWNLIFAVGGKSGGETGENPSKGDNQQQTQLTYDGR